MPVVGDIVRFLDVFAPPELAADWDNVGLLLGKSGAGVRRVMTCLTLTPDVAAEAIDEKVELIVSHHPVMFRGIRKLTDADAEGEMLLNLAASGIAVYSPHTSFDSTRGGINEQLAEAFGINSAQPLRPIENENCGGEGRWGELTSAVTLKSFCRIATEVLRTGYVEYCGLPEAPVRRVALACGAAGEFLEDAVRLQCDTFVTGEIRFHSVLQARTTGISLIVLGHYASERPAVEHLAAVIGAEFPELKVFAGRREADPLNVYTANTPE
ncbi:MAG: Nif3-like dinuclear metal center hexameric protein [Planctomycetaceae bacterium]|nr:Nif3-like dinuclear metal center hexameric protein [Planctomycetaceae bacterium]